MPVEIPTCPMDVVKANKRLLTTERGRSQTAVLGLPPAMLQVI
jgi:hypothetical protein